MKLLKITFLLLLSISQAFGAAKQIIVLTAQSDGTTITVNYILWLTTTSPVPIAGKGSVWQGASTVENNAIIAGTTIELPRTKTFPAGTTKATIQSALQTEWTSMQGVVNIQPNGCFFDGTSWSC